MDFISEVLGGSLFAGLMVIVTIATLLFSSLINIYKFIKELSIKATLNGQPFFPTFDSIAEEKRKVLLAELSRISNGSRVNVNLDLKGNNLLFESPDFNFDEKTGQFVFIGKKPIPRKSQEVQKLEALLSLVEMQNKKISLLEEKIDLLTKKDENK